MKDSDLEIENLKSEIENLELKLLVVDDDEQNLYMLQVLLGGHGYHVETAANGQEALDKARSAPPDMIISDILMPVMDGFTLCRRWKTDVRLNEIPFVFYTATYTDPRDEEFALSLGAERFIVKPVEPDAFVQMLQEVIAEHEAGRLASPREPVEEEAVYLREYNEALIRKLEDKVLQLEEANQELTSQRDRLHLLHRIDQAISSTLNLTDLLDQLAAALTTALGANRCSIWLLDESGEFLQGRGFAQERGYGVQIGEPDVGSIRLPRDEPLVARLFETGEPLMVPDVEDPAYADVVNPEYDAAFHIQAFLAVPLIVREDVIGLLVLDDTRARRVFQPDEIEFVQTVAGQAAIVIENARLFEAQRQSEERYRGIFEGVRDAILVESFSGEILDANASACEMFGWSHAEFLTKTVADLVPAGEAILRPDELLEQAPSDQPVETVNIRANGEHFPVEITGRLQTIDRDTVMLVVVRDITGRKQAEERLRLQGAALEAAANAIVITDREGVILWVNPAFSRLTGYSPEEALGQTPRLLKSEEQTPSFYRHLWETIMAGDVWRGQLINRRKDGSLYIDEQTITPLLNGSGEVSHFIAIKQDITDRVEAEEQLQLQMQRLAALRSVDMAITASVDLRVTLNILLSEVTAQLGVDAADILLLNVHTHTLEYAAGVGFYTDALRHTRLRLGDGHAGRAALERRRVEIPDLAEEAGDLTRALRMAGESFTAYYGVPLVAKGRVLGVMEIFHRAPLDPDADWLNFLETLATQAALAIDNVTLFNNLQRSNVDLRLAYDTTLEGWARALELRDQETEGHARRVTDLTLRLARAMGMRDEELVHVRRGVLLHDIGKMGIPDSILLKTGELNDDEWEVMRQHPVHAYNLLLPIPFLRPALDIPYCHHEKWDGTGYPRRLKGDRIPLSARIFAVVDVWDAVRSDRPYRKAWTDERAREHIREQAGKQFDPQVVEKFLELLEEK
ncbi:MAG: PAS domain S-box protein [Anaerolineae bacterium]